MKVADTTHNIMPGQSVTDVHGCAGVVRLYQHLGPVMRVLFQLEFDRAACLSPA